MNKKFINALALMLKLKSEDVEAALQSENGDDSVIKTYLEKHQTYTADELATLIKNSNKVFLEKADFDINEVPKELYGKIKKAALEKLEKDLAAKHQIALTEIKGLEDLVEKITLKSKGDKTNDEDKRQIETLKQTIAAKETELADFVKKIDAEKVTGEFRTALNGLPLDYDDTLNDNKTSPLMTQRTLLEHSFLSTHDVIKKGETIVVTDKNGVIKVNKLGDPELVSNVLSDYAKTVDFKLKEAGSGGRGTGSSSSTVKVKDFNEFATKNNLKPNTKEFDEAYINFKKQNN